MSDRKQLALDLGDIPLGKNTPIDILIPGNKEKRVGYIRVSSTDQNTDRQLDGIPLDKTFEDKQSGKDTARPGLQSCLDYCREGDTLFVHSIDRLARNLRDLQDIVKQIVDNGAVVVFMKENLRVSANETDNIGRFIFQIMGAFAEFERSMIKERQQQGIEIALSKGVKFGRRSVINEETGGEILLLMNKGLPKSEIARRLDVSRQSIYNFLKSANR